jgi:hypothetical protein
LYWLRGGWGFTVPDALFWGTLGGLVAINVQFDARRHPARRAQGSCGRNAAAGFSARGLAVRALMVAGTFTTIALLWSLWSSPSLGAWIDTLGRGVRGSWAFPRMAALPSRMAMILEWFRRGAYGS